MKRYQMTVILLSLISWAYPACASHSPSRARLHSQNIVSSQIRSHSRHTIASSTAAFSPAASPFSVSSQSDATCLQSIRQAETTQSVPQDLMRSIGIVESGRRDTDGQMVPWAWTINVEGVGHSYATKQQAMDSVLAYQAHGIRSIDVGCMQVNLSYHSNAFASLEEAFDPTKNANYAAEFLSQLRRSEGSWSGATGAYHSKNPVLGSDYRRRVMAVWPMAQNLSIGHEFYAPSERNVDLAIYTPAVVAPDVDLAVYTPAFAAKLKAQRVALGTLSSSSSGPSIGGPPAPAMLIHNPVLTGLYPNQSKNRTASLHRGHRNG
jgi:Transglycosylase SLT domain